MENENELMETTDTETADTEAADTKAADTQITNTEDETGEKRSFPTQVVLTIRTIVGAYVIYLAYQIITSDEEVTPWMWAAVVLFIVAGAALVIMSVKHFIMGEYEGGKKDV
ncbi:MAG: hypothetical protein K6E49_01940 [Lachnospiraceae bacterium]|nr:hypothetical protein [Lachnospiraceae bacterium]